jgi:hypothetical protein
MNNPITDEIRAIRHDLAAKFNNDLDRIVADLRRQQLESGREYIRLPKRSVRPDNAANQAVNQAVNPSGGSGGF